MFFVFAWVLKSTSRRSGPSTLGSLPSFVDSFFDHRFHRWSWIFLLDFEPTFLCSSVRSVVQILFLTQSTFESQFSNGRPRLFEIHDNSGLDSSCPISIITKGVCLNNGDFRILRRNAQTFGCRQINLVR